MEADAKTKYWAAAGTDVILRALSSRSPSGIQPRACGDPFREWAAGLCKAFAGVMLGTNPLESLSSLVLELVRPFKDTETSIDAHLVGQESDLFDVSLGTAQIIVDQGQWPSTVSVRVSDRRPQAG